MLVGGIEKPPKNTSVGTMYESGTSKYDTAQSTWPRRPMTSSLQGAVETTLEKLKITCIAY
jgi:hypothetical protein